MNHLIARGYPGSLPTRFAPARHWLAPLPLHHVSVEMTHFLLWYGVGLYALWCCNILSQTARSWTELVASTGAPWGRGEPPQLYLWAVEAVGPAALAAWTAFLVVTLKWWLGGDPFLPTWLVAPAVVVIILRRCWCWQAAFWFLMRPALHLARFAVIHTAWLLPWPQALGLLRAVSRHLPDTSPAPSQEDVDELREIRGPSSFPRDFPGGR